MAISNILDQKLDSRRNGEDCAFNGYLEDYLNLAEDLDPVLKEAFSEILAKDENVKICVNLKAEINKDAISNQIIRYKDVFKLAGRPLTYPFILYVSGEAEDRALLVVPYTKYSFILAKGYYYCMTEPGSPFIECKNEIVAVTSDNAAKIVNAFTKLFTMKAGALQRTIDRDFFRSYDELKALAVEAANTQKAEAPAVLAALEDRTEQIYRYVINWFLLKKVLYVQYMVNKNILNTVHEGNVKKQRNQAKLNADEVTFMSYSEMWRTEGPVTEEAVEEPAEEAVEETVEEAAAEETAE